MSSNGKKQVLDLPEWRRYGRNVPPAVFGMALVAVHSYGLGVMIAPLEQEFGWSRSQISAGPFVTSVVTLLLAVFGGRLVDRFGPRRVALVGVPFYAAALAAIATAGPSIISWLMLYALLGVALISIFPSVWTAAIAQRFEANRGIAMALVLSGTGIASATVPYLGANLIEAYGWRGAYIGLGTLSLIIGFPLVLFLFARETPPERPADRKLEKIRPTGTVAELVSPKFVRLAIAGVIYSLGATGLGINAVPILMGEGFNLINAAEIAGLIGIGTITGRVLGGFLLDHIDGRFVAMGCGLGALTAVVIFMTTDQSTLAASIACLMLGLTAGAELDACAYLTTRHFSPHHFASLFGFLGALFGFTAGIAPFIANALYDFFGNYDSMLIVVIPMFAIACVLFWSLGPYPDTLKDSEVQAS